MSDTELDQSPPSPPVTDHEVPHKPDLGSDILLWRKKHLSFLVLSVATATWTVMEIYQYSFITVLCYVAMAVVLVLFLWGNTHRLLKKESPDVSELEISEETAIVTASSIRRWLEEAVRVMFHVTVEREWFVSVGVVAVLYLLSLVGSCIDFLTFCYIGVVGLMTVPAIYVKNERRIRELGEKTRMKSQRMYSVIGEKLYKMKNRMGGVKEKEIKEKKTE